MLAVLLLGLVGLYLVNLIDPLGRSLTLPCVMHEATGLHCPGCGGTRAVDALARGDLASALTQNILLVSVVPMAFLACCIMTIRGISPLAMVARIPARGLWAIFVLLVLYTILRNLPWWPFILLAPH